MIVYAFFIANIAEGKLAELSSPNDVGSNKSTNVTSASDQVQFNN